MTIRIFLLVIASVLFSAVAQVSLKQGTTALAQARAAGTGSELVAFATQPYIIGGLALYGVGAILWLFVLGRAPLSVAYPFVGLGFVLTAVAGVLVLGEAASVARFGGTLLIAAGCVLVARSA